MLDLDALLAPISEIAPTGEDLSFSPEFDRIQEYRRADDPTLDQGEWQTEIKYADWPSARRACAELLQTRTKDLRLAGWLAEAATQIDGFAGLSQGYRLMAGLCDRYWDQLHPAAYEGDQEERIGNLVWVLSNSLLWLRRTPIVSAPQGRFALADFEAAHSRSGQEDAGDDHPRLEQLEAARRDTSVEFYRLTLAALADCSESLVALQTSVDTRLGQDGPSFSAVRDQVLHLQRTTLRFAHEAGLLLDEHADPAGEDDPSLSAASSGAEPASAAPARGPAGAPTSRKEALVQLRQVAEFFRRTEPHSPVAYLAEKAARWGEMPLHVWLRRVVKDDMVLRQMEEMLDIEQGPDGQ